MYDFLQKYIAMKSTKLIRSEYPQSANAKIGLNLSIPIALIIKHLNYFDFQSYSKWMWITSPHPKNTNPANSSRGHRFCCTFSSSWNETKIIEKQIFIYFCSCGLFTDITITLVSFVELLNICLSWYYQGDINLRYLIVQIYVNLVSHWDSIKVLIVDYKTNLEVYNYYELSCNFVFKVLNILLNMS